MSTVMDVKNISKQYRLGQVGTGTLIHDIRRAWHLMRKKEDPYLKLGTINDRESDQKSDYVWALKNINFEIEQGDLVGIIGRNGAGKSTLLKILSQITAPTTGTIKIKGRVASLLEVGTGFHPDLTGRENIFLNGAILGMSKADIKKRLDDIISFSGCQLFIDTPVKRYSSGMLVRLGFAVAAHLEPDILIVDEVLAVGDSEFQEKCIGKMKDIGGQGRTVLFVSHNMASMKSLCKKGILMDKGGISFQGSMSETVEYYLSSKTKFVSDGTIERGLSSINTNQVKYTRAVLKDKNGNNTDTVFYLSPIQIELEIESDEDFRDVIMDIRIVSFDGIEIAHTMNKYQADLSPSLKKGTSVYTCTIDNMLQPGSYSLTLGIHLTNGKTLEYVENVCPFNVSRLGEEGKENFHFDFSLAYVRFNSTWKLI